MNSVAKVLTLVIPCKDNRVLLGYKKRGFGVGWWNGFGGKVQRGESVKQAALRELDEECGVQANEEDLIERGTLTFSFDGSGDLFEVHVFSVECFRGAPCESEEMRPQWFKHQDIPFGEMWPDDIYWFPYFLQKRTFRGRFHFDKDHAIIQSHLEEVTL